MMNQNRKNRLKAAKQKAKRATFVTEARHGRCTFMDANWDRAADAYIESGDTRHLSDFPCDPSKAPAEAVAA